LILLGCVLFVFVGIGFIELASPYQKVSQNQRDIADLMDRLGNVATMLKENADYALSSEAERDMNEFLKYGAFDFLIKVNHSLHNRRIQRYEGELQLKKDRWLLRKGVEAADDEQEILRHLRQIAITFDEFQVRAYSSRALSQLTNEF
jgi:hypothetical protein